MEKRPGRPGMAGESPKKSSGFATQLREKQKLRIMFGLSDKQMKRLVQKAVRMKGLTTDNIMRQLEMRLDNVLYRAGFALTRNQGRQMATHGHFLVNGRRTDIPSYLLSIGDSLELRPKLKNSKLYSAVLEENKGYRPSRWLSVSQKDMKVQVAAEPMSEDFEKVVDGQKILEFYSR